MKPFRVTIALLTLLIVLGGLAYWDEIKTSEEKGIEESSNRFFMVETENIASWTYQKKSDQGLVVISGEKDQGQWRIIAPQVLTADDPEVNRILKSVIDYKYERKLNLENFEKATYGLDNPAISFEFKDLSGQIYKLMIGNKLPVGYSNYLMKEGDDSVYVGSQYIMTALDKSLYDFRSKSLGIPLESEIQGFSLINAKGQNLSFERNESNDWMLRHSELVKSDESEISDFLSGLRQTTIKEFIDEPSDSIRKALDVKNPGTELIGRLQIEKNPGLVLNWTFIANGDHFYAFQDDQSTFSYVVLDSKLKDLFNKNDWDFRFKNVFNFDSNEVVSVKINDRNYVKEKDQWLLSENQDQQTNYDHIRSLLVDLEFAKARELWDEERFKREISNEPIHQIQIGLPNHVLISIAVWQYLDNSIIIKKSDHATYYRVGSDVLENLEAKSIDKTDENQNSSHDS